MKRIFAVSLILFVILSGCGEVEMAEQTAPEEDAFSVYDESLVSLMEENESEYPSDFFEREYPSQYNTYISVEYEDIEGIVRKAEAEAAAETEEEAGSEENGSFPLTAEDLEELGYLFTEETE